MVKASLEKNWIKLGAILGIASVLAYTVMLSVPLPMTPTVVLASLFGPLLGAASVGLYHFLKLYRRTVILQLATLSNVIAGVIVTLMLLVQMSVAAYFREAMSEESSPALQATWQGVNRVQLGLDVAWDVFIGIGTLLFAVSVLRHPRLGRLFGGTGIVIAIGLLILNFSTFPTPPAEAGSVDLGPLVGLWYLSVSIQVLRSLGWVEKRFLETSG